MPIKNTIIYRFSGNLFFANIDTFESDIENAVTDETKNIIIDARAVGSIDIAAADKLVMMYRKYAEKGIKFYFTEHIGEVNDLLRKYGETEFLNSGAVRMTVTLALRDAGLKPPYPTEKDIVTPQKQKKLQYKNSYNRSARGIQAELEWVFGDDTEIFKSKLADEIYENVTNTDYNKSDLIETAENSTHWGKFNLFDEEDLLDRLELRIIKLSDSGKDIDRLEYLINERRKKIEQKMLKMDSHAIERLQKQRKKFLDNLREKDISTYEMLVKYRESHK